MQGIGETLKNRTQTTSRSEKADVLGQLYVLYTSENALRWCKKTNAGRYSDFLIKSGISPIRSEILKPANLAAFRKTKLFVKRVDQRAFSVFLSKHKLNVLYEILSVAKDKENRLENVGAYIAGNFWKFSR